MRSPLLKRITQNPRKRIRKGIASKDPEQAITWIICGVAGAGKTRLAQALAKKFQYEFLDADDSHPASNLRKMRSGRALNEGDRKQWLKALERRLKGQRSGPRILAFPGLKRRHRQRIAKAAAPVRFIFLNLPERLARLRVAKRGGFFPPELVAAQFQALESPTSKSLQLDAQRPFSRVLAAAAALIAEYAGISGLKS